MQTKKRQPEPSVIQRLIDEPYRFQFVHAVNTLLLFLRKNGVEYDQAFTHVLRFQNSLSLSFPSSQIEGLYAGTDVEARTDTMLRLTFQQPGTVKICITPAFIGFLGISGTLPFHYSESIADTVYRHKDASERAFVDAFSNRLVGLFYQSWGKYRLEQSLVTRGEDTLLPMLLTLGGVTSEAFTLRLGRRSNGGVNEQVAAFYAALLRTRPVSAHSIERVLAEYFSVPIQLEQFVGGWDPIPENMLSKLGGPNPRLGYGAALGVRLWRHDLRVRLNIGPLDKNDFDRFLPRGEGAAALEKMLALFGLPCMQFEARLILSAQCVEPVVLTTRHRAAAKRLGWNTFLKAGPGKVLKPEIRYMLNPA